MNDALKDRIGGYELLAVIGDGAQGKVFKARCVEAGGPVVPDEVVALKVLRVPPDDDQARARFEAQAAILKRLANPHVIRYRDAFVWHAGEWDEAQCLVMDCLDGETLAARLAAARRGLPWPDVKRVFEQCLDGLIYAAGQGLIHRDLKPSNIFLTREGGVRIFDFDIARIEGERQRSTLGWKGSFDYMAPDFLTQPDFHGDERSDIFSLGTCLCQALTGQLPFEPLGDNAHIGYLNRWRDPAAPPAPSLKAGVYRVLANARQCVGRSLSPARDQRFASFAEMLSEFRRIRPRVVRHLGKDAYELREFLGRGGFGEVFAGVRLGDGRPVAIKHLFAERQSPRFVKEAKLLQRYRHPFLVKYEDFIEVQNAAREKQYFLVLELLEGMPGACLRNRVKREGPLDPVEAVPLFMNYLDALGFLHGHARPLVHRDIKPMNLYAPPGRPDQARVFDLGVARDVSGTMTSGGIPGTLDYMAPEFAEADADRGSPRSDLYSLGLCLYEALVGQTAFPRLPPEINSSWPQFQERARTRPAIDFRARVFLKYPDLANVVRKAIEFDPRHRYAGAAAMRQDLENVLRRLDKPEAIPPAEDVGTLAVVTPREPPVNPPPAPAPEAGPPAAEAADSVLPDFPESDEDATAAAAQRRRRSLRAALALLAALAAAAAATAWWAGPGARPSPSPPPPVTSARMDPPVPAAAATPAAAESPLAASAPLRPEPPAVPDVPVEPVGLQAARDELDLLARSVRIPVADPAYVDRLSEALARLRLLGDQYPALAADAGRKAAVMERLGRDLPALFQAGQAMGLAQDDVRTAADMLAAWRGVRRHAALMGLTGAQADAEAAAMESKLGRHQLAAAASAARRLIPSRLAGAGDIERAELAAAALEALAVRSWPGVTEAERQAAVDALRAEWLDAIRAGLAAWRDGIVALYREGRDGGDRHAALASLPDDAPAATALVPGEHRSALAAADRARADWERLARCRRAVLEAIETGAGEVDREALAALPVDPDDVLETAAAARRARAGFDLFTLLEATEPARVFMAAVSDCWKKAQACEGPLGEAVRDAAWAAIHDPLAAQGALLLQPQEMMRAGVRTPEQQARLRREYLRLLAQVEHVTGRVAGCPAGDPLRAQAVRFFQPPFFHRALLENPADADAIPWLAEEFRKVRAD